MGTLIRAMDWAQTPLGPLDTWPQSLRTTVSLCLASNFPISIAWGPHRVQIYNDGYWPICGGKHPRSLGQDFKECWFSAWPAIGEAFERAASGETSFLENRRMFLDRHGYLEETFFTFSFSPIQDETGGVGGLFHPVTEMTQQTLAERRLKVVRDLADRTADAQSVAQACVLIAQTLAACDLDLPFILLYLLDTSGTQARLASSAGLAPGTVASPEAVDLLAPPHPAWPLAEVVRSGRLAQVDEVVRQFGPLACGPYPESPQTALVLPISLAGLAQPFGVLVAGVSARRALDEAYRTFYEMLKDTVTNALTNARAYEEERKRAEALAELDRAKTAFFSNVSHEFRTPLTLMLGPLEQTLASGPGALTPPQHAELEVVHRNGLRLLKLVNTLLDFSRIEAGRIAAVYEPTDLATYTAELASVFRSAIERAGLRLVVECPPLPAPVYVDREMWEKIVLNLLSNAFKFTFEGEIAVRLDWCGDHVTLAVRDTGTGIPTLELPYIFERFHRVRNARARTHEGTGIGLALVQELARLHGGEITVVSAVEVGTTFTVTVPTGTAHLPADRVGTSRSLASTALAAEAYVQEALRWLADGPESERDAEAQSPYAAASPLPSVPASARILLVDDNADMREYVRRLLSQHWEVMAVADGLQALAVARDCVPDLVLTDIMMPGLDGFALLRALRADPHTATIPIILLSARAGEEARVEGLEAGADDYLIKPFAARELLARVETHLKLQRLRNEAQAAVRDSEARFRTLADAAPAMIWCLDEHGHISYVNQRYLDYCARPLEEVLGPGWHALLHPEDGPAYLAEVQAAIRERRPLRSRARVQRHDGQWRWLESHALPLHAADGQYLGHVGVSQDVTEAVQSEEILREQVAARTADAEARAQELARANAALREESATRQQMQASLFQREKLAAMGSLLASVAHELNNPLSIILLHADLLRADAGTAPLAECAAEIIQAATRCERLVRQFLTLARQQAPERTTVDLNALLTTTLELLQPSLRVDTIAVDLCLAEGLPPLWADPHHLQQVVVNLITNAQQALRDVTAPRQLRLTTGYDVAQRRVTLEIADTGLGMSPDVQARIFEPFFTTKPPGVGTGLGLPLCLGIVEDHGGTLRCTSQPGQGTTFRVELPVHSVPEAPPTAAATAHALPAVGSSAILIVDDEPSIANALARLLRRDGHTVDTAANGRLALKQLQERAYDLILSDLRMPELDGPALYRGLEQQYPQMCRRFIFLTGDTLNPEAMAFVEQRGIPRLTKPFTGAEVRHVIQQVLRAG
jgi:PAS domain S-box-containing protein